MNGSPAERRARRLMRISLIPGATLAVTATCIPNLGPGDSLITSPRVLAVRAVPAEANPGTPVTFTAFAVDTGGTIPSPKIIWDFCTAPLPLTEDNVVSNACLGASSIVPAGFGEATTAPTPEDACALFGPDVIQGDFRPPDPDSTGGYYQPLRALMSGSDAVFELARIHCDLANASASAVKAFAAAYKLNQNPTLLPLTGAIRGSPVPLDAIPAGASLVLTASWPASSAETFAYYDPATATVTTQREAMQVAWYSTADSLETEATGRTSTDSATTTTDTWTAPSAPGTSHAFVVLRDSRGGVDFVDTELTVVP
jgi:hypothetical protein